jgi:hypothetical protein
MSAPKFSVGDRVVDRETGQAGTIVYLYEDPRLAGEIIAVKFDTDNVPMAVPVDTLRKASNKPTNRSKL